MCRINLEQKDTFCLFKEKLELMLVNHFHFVSICSLYYRWSWIFSFRFIKLVNLAACLKSSFCLQICHIICFSEKVKIMILLTVSWGYSYFLHFLTTIDHRSTKLCSTCILSWLSKWAISVILDFWLLCYRLFQNDCWMEVAT